MNQDTTSPTLTINVRQSEGAVALDAESNLFEQEMKEVLSWIRQHAEDMGAAGDPDSRHQHDAILISGPRGSGKTTFMLTLKKRIEAEKFNGSPNQVCVLDPLDPSLIEGDEIFLATIIAAIYRALKHEKQESDPDVVKAMQALSSALLTLDSQATRKKLEDVANSPSLFGERLLNTALSGLDLQHRFTAFSKAASRALRIRFFALFLDDVDTAFGQGALVLETVRRYCIDGRVLPIISGDLRLFQLVLRERIWRDLQSVTKSEQRAEMASQIYSQVVELEGQYLLKVLRPERRLELPAPRKRLESYSSIQLELSDGRQAELRRLMNRLNFGLFNVRHVTTSRAQLPLPAGAALTENTRQIRAAIAWIAELLNKEFMPKGGHPHIDDQPIFANPTRLFDLHPRIRETSMTSDILSAISIGNYQPLSKWICSNLFKYPEIFRLDPLYLEDGHDAEPWRIAILALQVALIQRWRVAPLEQIDYIAVVLSPALAMPVLDRRKHNSPPYSSGETAIPSSWCLGQPVRSPWQTAARVTATLVNDWQDSRSPSYYKLRRKTREAAVKKIHETFSHGIPKTCAEVSAIPAKVATDHGLIPWLSVINNGLASLLSGSPKSLKELYPIVGIWKTQVDECAVAILDWYTVELRYYNATMKVVDPWSGFCAIADLLRIEHGRSPSNRTGETQKVETSGDIEWLLSELLNDIGKGTTFTIPAFSTGGEQTTQSDDFDDAEVEIESPESEDESNADETSSRPPHALTKSVQCWTQLCRTLCLSEPSNAAALASLASRFKQNQLAIYNDYPSKAWTVGYILQSWALSWLNACLLADAGFAGVGRMNEDNLISTRTGATNSSKGSQNQLVKNIESLKRALDSDGSRIGATAISKTPFPRLFVTFATCPLIYGLLSEEWLNFVSSACDDFIHRNNTEVSSGITPIKSKFSAAPNSQRPNADREHFVFNLLCGLTIQDNYGRPSNSTPAKKTRTKPSPASALDEDDSPPPPVGPQTT